LSASDYGSINTPAEESDGELVFKSPLIFATEDPMERQGAATSVKARMFFKNIGDRPISLASADIYSLEGGTFSIAGASGSGQSSIPVVLKSLDKSGYIFQLTKNYYNNSSDPHNLRIGDYVKVSKSYSPGLKGGGQMFTKMLLNPSDGSFTTFMVNGLPDVYFQNNMREIKDNVGSSSSGQWVLSSNFIIEDFFSSNYVSSMPGGAEGYIDVIFDSPSDSSMFFNLITEDADELIEENGGDNIVVPGGDRFFNGEIKVWSDTFYSPQIGRLKSYVGDGIA
jgi:hypothetical protein